MRAFFVAGAMAWAALGLATPAWAQGPHPERAVEQPPAEWAILAAQAQGVEAALEALLTVVGQPGQRPERTEKPLSWVRVGQRVVRVEGPLGGGHVSYLADGTGRLVAAHLLLALPRMGDEQQDLWRAGDRFFVHVRRADGGLGLPASEWRWLNPSEQMALEAAWAAWQAEAQAQAGQGR